MRATALFALLSLVTAVAQASLPGGGVGEVSLVIGKAWIDRPGERRERVTVGTEVGVYDRIETASDGHVHIRFVDQGLFSVRPYSTLEIEQYDYDAADPESSAIKFNVIEGEARSISGDAAHKARQNFRMNTPIAAIGVRGTDFVVNAEAQEVTVRVNEGAIIVAPFSSQCFADALGPCQANALELTDATGQTAAVSSRSLAPVLLSGSGATSIAGLIPEEGAEVRAEQRAEQRGVAVAASDNQQKEPAASDRYVESATSLAVNERLTLTKAQTDPGKAPGVAPPPIVTTPEFTPDVALSAQMLKNSQLLWGRWNNAPAQAHDRITVDNATLIEGRRGAVSNEYYALYRLENAPRMQSGLGVIGFALNSAQAVYRANGTIELMDVSGGLLSIDFNANTFATSLDLHSTVLGAVGFSANGRISDNSGYFNMVGAMQQMAGAVSLDGAEAAYFFQKTLDSGTIDGLTLWGRQP